MENIKNNTQPSVKQHEKLSLEGLSDDTIKLINLSMQILRMENEVRSIIINSNYLGKELLFDDNVEFFSDYSTVLLSSVSSFIINDVLTKRTL